MAGPARRRRPHDDVAGFLVDRISLAAPDGHRAFLGLERSSTVPLLMVGLMMVAAPFVMLLHGLQTLFAITTGGR